MAKSRPPQTTLAHGAMFMCWRLCCLAPSMTTQRDAVLEELHAGGKGTLVHPHLGTWIVQVRRLDKLQASTLEGGLAKGAV